MFKTKTRIIIIGLLLQVLCIYGLYNLLQPLHYGAWFYAAASIYALVFMIYVGINEYYSQYEVDKIRKSSSSNRLETEKIKYKSNSAYQWAGLLSVIISVIPVTLVIAGMYLNQNEIYQVKWYWWIAIAFAGLMIMFSILLVHEIGQAKRARKDTGMTGSPYGISQETMDIIGEGCNIFTQNSRKTKKNSWITEREALDAKIKVDTALREAGGKLMENIYIFPVSELRHDFKFGTEEMLKFHEYFDRAVLKDFMDFSMYVSDNSDNGIESSNAAHDYYNNFYENDNSIYELERKLPTVQHWYDCAADIIHYAKIQRGKK